MKKIIITSVLTLALAGCTASAPPICSNKAKIANHTYDIDVFKKEDGRYLAGYPFYNWTDKSQFIDTSGCDKLHP